MSELDDAAIERFLDALWMEHGLSANTLNAYRYDLTGCSNWLSSRDKRLQDAQRADLLSYISRCVKNGASARTTARLLSALRRFYRYLVRQGVLTKDPTAELE